MLNTILYIDLSNLTGFESFLIFVIFLAVASMITGLLLLIRNLKRDLKESQDEAFYNLGRPMDLKYVDDKLLLHSVSKFVIHVFIPNDPAKNPPKRIHGVGVISNPKRPKCKLFVKMVFKAGEKISPDGETIYIVKPASMIVDDLCLVKVSEKITNVEVANN